MASSPSFRSIRGLTSSERAEQLLPLGLTNPLGERGRDLRRRAIGPRTAALPNLQEACRMPDASYAFWHATPTALHTADGRWREASADVARIETGLVTCKHGSAHWTEAWRSGMKAWTRDARELVGAWVRLPREPEVPATWQSLRAIDAQDDVDLLVWLPTWPAWRLIPRRSAPVSDSQAVHPSAVVPRSALHDNLFIRHGGPCADAPGGLAAAFPRHGSALAGLQVHIVDRGDVRHYLYVWGETEWEGKSNLLPQASVVFVHGDATALAAFYAWMRHVVLPVYPVLHDAEWARDHDDDQSYNPHACGHPSLLATPAEGVAVAIVFDEDLRALRELLTMQLQCATTTEAEAAPSWVPVLSEPYDHPLALAAAWAVTDPRVGWRAWAARRPNSWSGNLTAGFRAIDWPAALETRRWGYYPEAARHHMTVDTCVFYVRGDYRPTQTERGSTDYETDAIGRVPMVRNLWAKAAAGGSSRHSQYFQPDVAAVRVSFAACGDPPRINALRSPDGGIGGITVGLGERETFAIDATGRAGFLGTYETTLNAHVPYCGGWRRAMAWHHALAGFTRLTFPNIRASLSSFVSRFVDDFRWENQCLVVSKTIVAEITENGLVTISGLPPVFMDGTVYDWFGRGAPNLPVEEGEKHGVSRVARALVTAVANAEHAPKTSVIASLERQIELLPPAASHRTTLEEITAYASDVLNGTPIECVLRFLLLWNRNAGNVDWRLYAVDTRDGVGFHVLEWFSYHKEWRQPVNYRIPEGLKPMDYVRSVFNQMLARRIAATSAPTSTG